MGHKSYIDMKLVAFIHAMKEYDEASNRFAQAPDDDKSRRDANSEWCKSMKEMGEAHRKIDEYICSVVKGNLEAKIVDYEDERY